MQEEEEKMFCPNCGMKVGEQDNFCRACGKSLSGEQETKLYSFGPWGVNVCFNRPRFFVWTQKNDTKIVLTDRRIYGPSSFTGSLRFQTPYNAILAKESFNFDIWKVLWIQYRDAEKTKEVSIMCTPFNSLHIARAYAYDMLQKAQQMTFSVESRSQIVCACSTAELMANFFQRSINL